MITTATPATLPRRSALPRDAAMRLAATEYARFSTAIAELQPEEWALPTDCPDWNVQQLVGHVVGMARMAASPSSRSASSAPLGRAVRRGPPWSTRSPPCRSTAMPPSGRPAWSRLMERTGPRAARGRLRLPGFLRRRPLPEPEVVDGVPEDWTLGYVVDTILTRDTWMHRSTSPTRPAVR